MLTLKIIIAIVFVFSGGLAFRRMFSENLILELLAGLVSSVAFVLMLHEVVDWSWLIGITVLVVMICIVVLYKTVESLPVPQQQQQTSVQSQPAEVKSSAKPPSKSVAGSVFQDRLKNGGWGPKMVWIPKGSFNMGSEKYDTEKPVHKVTIGYDYAMSQYEVTFDDYDRFCEATGRAKPSDAGWGRGQRPVINVSWEDGKAYSQWLTEQTGKPYRLPTEAEWEYACRAGTTTVYSFGDDASQLGTYAWYDKNSGGKTHPVGEKKPNAFGLYDMHGNVWEWVEDVWHDNYEGAPVGGSAWVSGGTSDAHLLRGGSWFFNDNGLRCASRYRSNATDRYLDGGLRLSRM